MWSPLFWRTLNLQLKLCILFESNDDRISAKYLDETAFLFVNKIQTNKNANLKELKLKKLLKRNIWARHEIRSG